MDFGSTIRAARESHGLTTNQVAAQTRVVVQIIEEMERNDFSQIAAPIYGRGFVKLICECLELDPTEMVALFMAEYNHPHVIEKPRPNKQPAFAFARHTEQPTAPAPAAATPAAAATPEAPPQEVPPPQDYADTPMTDVDDNETAEPPNAIETVMAEADDAPSATAPAAAPAAEAPAAAIAAASIPPKMTIDSALQGLELFDRPADSVASPASSPVAPIAPAAPEPPPLAGLRQQTAAAPADDFSRFATPLPPRQNTEPSTIDRFCANLAAVSSSMLTRVRERHRSYLRITLLILSLALVVGLIIWGIIALFRATSHTAPTEPESPATQEIQEQQPAAPQNDKQDEPEAETPAPTKATVPLKLQGFYID